MGYNIGTKMLKEMFKSRAERRWDCKAPDVQEGYKFASCPFGKTGGDSHRNHPPKALKTQITSRNTSSAAPHRRSSRFTFKRLFARCFQIGDAVFERGPYKSLADVSIIVHIEVACFLDKAPRYMGQRLFCFIRKQTDQFTDLHDTHAAGILYHGVPFKRILTVSATTQILLNTFAVRNNVFQNSNVTQRQKASPRPSECLQIVWGSRRPSSRYPQIFPAHLRNQAGRP